MRTFTLRERLLDRFNLLPLPIYDAFVSPLFGHVLVKAVRFQLFDLLLEPQTTQQLAESTRLDPHAVDLMLSSLVSSGYIKIRNGIYTTSASGRKWLVSSSPSYIGNFLRYVELLYTHWLYLDETIEQGNPPVTYVESFGEKEWEIYVYGMLDLARIIIPHVIPKIALPKNSENIIDIGGSHGMYSIELCRRNPRLRATIVDFPQALKFTQNIIKDHDFENQISTEPGNIIEKEFAAHSYDAALAFNIVHGLNEKDNRLVFQRISSALKPHGVLFVLDQFHKNARSKLEQFLPLMVGINLMNEVGGTVYSIDNIREWSMNDGFANIHEFRLRLPGVTLLRIEK